MAKRGDNKKQKRPLKCFGCLYLSWTTGQKMLGKDRPGLTRYRYQLCWFGLLYMHVYPILSHIIPLPLQCGWFIDVYINRFIPFPMYTHTHIYIYIHIWSYMHIVPLFLINLSIQSPFLLLSTVPLAVHERFVKLKRMTSSRARQAWSILVPSMPEICWESDLDLSNMGFSEAMQDCVRWYDMVLECIWCGRIM